LFQSSKKLGRGSDTKREALRRALAESRAGIDVEKNEGLLYEPREVREYEPDRSDDDGLETALQPAARSVPSQANGRKRDRSATPAELENDDPSPIVEALAAPPPPQNNGAKGLFSGVGSGLKRPLEVDESGKPVIQIRKRRKAQQKKPIAIEEDVAWDGFSSGEESNAEDGVDEADASNASEHVDEADASSASEDIEHDSDEMEDSESESESESEESEEGSEEESDEDSYTSPDEEAKTAKKEKRSAFTAWATQRRNEQVGFIPTNQLSIPQAPTNFKPRAPEQDPLPAELATKTVTDATRKAFSVNVERSPEIQESRLQLPIVAEEQKIMEAIHNNHVVVVWGATGSGKTTQVPQFLFESGYGAADGPTPGMIGVTQPRRVAAVSMSKRVGHELGDQNSKVAYQIRFDTTTSAKTAIKFMTDGVLLREITQDFILTKYSAIVIDEAHERSVNTDILIGMLSRIVDLRAQKAKEDPKYKPLKLIIMSATLRISDFTENKRLFRAEPPPLIKAEGRQYSVANHFARRTQRDYVEEMYRKICRGHRKLPKGGMLVFLTGQNEISQLAKRLKQAFSSTQGLEVKAGKVVVNPAETPLEAEDIELGTQKDAKDYLDDDESDSEGSMIMGLDDEDDKEFEIEDEKPEETVMNIHVLPLYSQLPTNQQLRVFEPSPEGSRLIVLATNVAETSLTIPGIRYVFDCGRAKEKKYDLVTGVQSFEVGWISRASASQRSGRAGRTGPGHCYRLYSSAVFERDFEEYAAPEISRTPLEGVVLQLKSMGAPIVGFPFPTPPDLQSLKKAEDLLSYLGAISSDGKVTKLGHELSLYPLNPRFARMVAMGVAQNLTAETIALVAALSVPELIIPENKLGLREPTKDPDAIRTEQDNIEAEERTRQRKAYNSVQAKMSINAKQSDCIKLSTAVCAYAYQPNTDSFCDEMFLNAKAMNEASQLRHQLTNIVRAHRPTAIGAYQAKLPAPSERSINLLTQICAAGFIDQIAMRADLAPVPPELPRKPKTAIEVPYITLFSSQSEHSDDPQAKYVYLHPSSLLARTPPAKMPGYIVYSHLQRAATQTIHGSRSPKTRLHPLTPVTRPQIINIALNTPLLQASKPKGKIVEMGKDRRECEVEMSLMGEKGSQGWGLGVRKVIQRKEGGGRWVVEKILG
jgi:ATP-dependent RNA helicase DHX37/DHR1